MKYLVFAFAFSLVLASCSKEGLKDFKKDKSEVYYSEDFKTAEGDVLGVSTAEIDVLWVEFFCGKDKDVDYKLILKDVDGKLTYEYGTTNSAAHPTIEFIPETGEESYSGTFNGDKSEYTVSLPNIKDAREFTFIAK